MDRQIQLIGIYEHVCQQFQQGLSQLTQRFSNNHSPLFIDQEVITIYLFGIIHHHRSVQAIYDYMRSHFIAYFPRLPSYKGYVHRPNLPGPAFMGLLADLKERMPQKANLLSYHLVDSMPIVLAQAKRAKTAKIASPLADASRCSAKDMACYGVKLHMVASARYKKMPWPVAIGLSKGSEHDLTALRNLLPAIENTTLYRDRIFWDKSLMNTLKKSGNLYYIIKRHGMRVNTVFRSLYVKFTRHPRSTLTSGRSAAQSGPARA